MTDHLSAFTAYVQAMRDLPGDLDPELWMDFVEALKMTPREMAASCVALYGLDEARKVADAITKEIQTHPFWN